MIISYQHAYIWGSSYFIPIWVYLFFRMPQHRKSMIIFSLSYMWIGLACEYFIWIKDWWHPITITGTPIGIEDLIMCFTHVGIPIFIYKYVFGKDIDKTSPVNMKESAKRLFLLLLASFVP